MSLRSEKYPSATTEQEYKAGIALALIMPLAVAAAISAWEMTHPAQAQVATVTAPVRNVGNCQQNVATGKLTCQ